MNTFLVLQLRPETKASDDEYQAFLDKGNLRPEETTRIRLDQQSLPADLNILDYSGVIVAGGPGCVSDAEDKKTVAEKRIEDEIFKLMPAIVETDFPYLGCCYGIGILAHHLGAKVSKERYFEGVGPVECEMTPGGNNDPLLDGFPDKLMAFVGHKEAVQELPADCAHLLSSNPCPFQMIWYKSNIYATQFHPEADGAVFETRIKLYKNFGYFPPSKAETLIENCHRETVDIPERILKNFVNTYR